MTDAKTAEVVAVLPRLPPCTVCGSLPAHSEGEVADPEHGAGPNMRQDGPSPRLTASQPEHELLATLISPSEIESFSEAQLDFARPFGCGYEKQSVRDILRAVLGLSQFVLALLHSEQ